MLSILALVAAVNVVDDCGADPTGATDSTAEIQACVVDGADIYFPPGVYTVSRTPSTQHAIYIYDKERVTMRAPGGATLKLAGGDMGGSDYATIRVHLSSRVRISGLTLDGNRANTTNEDEQTHGVLHADSSDVVYERMEFVDWHGDGIKILGNGSSKRITVRDCDFRDNGRSGITMQSYSDDVLIVGNRFRGMSDQSIDFEPTGDISPSRVSIVDNRIEGDSDQVVLTLSGSGTEHTRDIVVRGNDITGLVHAVRLKRALIDGNTIRSTGRCLDMTREIVDVTITHNRMECSTEGLYTACANGSCPRRVVLEGNSISAPRAWSHEGGGDGDLVARGNVVVGNGTLPAFRFRNTAATTLRGILVDGNHATAHTGMVDVSPTHGPIVDVVVDGSILRTDSAAKVLTRSSTAYSTCRVTVGSFRGGGSVTAGDGEYGC